MKITVFTPSYNRGYIIEALYRSLQRQSFRDFEWIVIDDGSTDDTEQLFARILSEENDFPIRYLKVENGGKHRAINRGVQMASGELFFIVDSDDYLTDQALERVVYWENSIPQNEKSHFGGVCGLRGKDLSTAIGTSFAGDYLDITTLERTAHQIDGDKAEVFYTELLRKFPFPSFDGEKFVTECIVWDRIAHNGYKLRFFNEIIYICDYLPDGLTAQGSTLFQNSPKGYGLYLSQSAKYGKTRGFAVWKSYCRYYYRFRKTLSFSEIAENLNMNPVSLWLERLIVRIHNRAKKALKRIKR